MRAVRDQPEAGVFPGAYPAMAVKPRSTRLLRGGSNNAVVKWVSSHRIFGVLDGPALRELAREATERTFPKGHYLFYSGDPPNFVYLVKAGLAALVELDEQGHLHPVQTYSSGDVFGLGTVILGLRRRFSAAAITDVDAVLVPRETFDRLCRHFPALTLQVMRELASMLYRSQETSFNLTLTPVSARIARFLLDAAKKQGEPTPQHRTFGLQLSRNDLALVVGTTRETVARVLSRLSTTGLVEVRKDQVRILRPQELRRLAQYSAI